MNLIDKDAVAAEFRRRIQESIDAGGATIGVYLSERMKEDSYILSFIDTLEVKEVDFEKAARNYLLHEHLSPLNNILHQADLKTEMQYHKDIETAFKNGFELGLKAQQK